jgi:hydrogenase maturation protease
MSARVLVVGCGTPTGDDAAGPAVVARLEAEGVPADVRLGVAAGGHQLLDLLDGEAALVLVDAIASGAPPGRVHRIPWPDRRLASLGPGSTHDFGPMAALALAEVLGLLPARVVALGVELADATPGAPMSDVVAAAVPALAAAVRAELGTLGAAAA